MLNMRRMRVWRVTLLTASVGCMCYILIWYLTAGKSSLLIPAPSCTLPEGNFIDLKWFNDSDVTDANSVFFLETTGYNDVSERAACSIESAARAMKNRTVFVLMQNETLDIRSDAIRILHCFPNIKFRYANFERLLGKVGLSTWYESQLPKYPPYIYSHLSDAVRASLLYLYGGIYLDTDVLVQKPLDDLPDCIALESSLVANVAVTKLRPKHPFLKEWIGSIRSRFVPKKWGSAGPMLVTELIKEMCWERDLVGAYLRQEKCPGDIPKLLPPSYFYMIPYTDHGKFFLREYAQDALERVRDSYAVHLWNKLNYDIFNYKKTPTAYNVLAKKYCQFVFGTSKEYF